jgi:hypothetical protein
MHGEHENRPQQQKKHIAALLQTFHFVLPFFGKRTNDAQRVPNQGLCWFKQLAPWPFCDRSDSVRIGGEGHYFGAAAVFGRAKTKTALPASRKRVANMLLAKKCRR